MTEQEQATEQAMGKLLRQLAGHPKTRQTVLKGIQEINPGYRLPADVAIEDFKAQQKAEREKEKRDTWVANRKNYLTRQRHKLIADGRYSEEQVKEIEEQVLKKYPNLDYNDAAVLYGSDKALAAPNPRERPRYQGEYWEIPSIPGLVENPVKAANDMAHSIIDEFVANRGRR